MRDGDTYRCNGGGKFKHKWSADPKRFKAGGISAGRIPLNRSDKWRPARTYQEARAMSPMMTAVR